MKSLPKFLGTGLYIGEVIVGRPGAWFISVSLPGYTYLSVCVVRVCVSVCVKYMYK